MNPNLGLRFTSSSESELFSSTKPLLLSLSAIIHLLLPRLSQFPSSIPHVNLYFFFFLGFLAVKYCDYFVRNFLFIFVDLQLHGDDVYFTLENSSSSSDVPSNTASSKVRLPEQFSLIYYLLVF